MKRMWKIGAKPVVLAHRGGGNEAVENSLSAFAAMEEKGFTYIETDSRATRDGVVVLFHDDDLERTTDAQKKIAQYSWAELQNVRDHSGHSIVRFDEALQKFPHIIFNVDAKCWSVVKPLARIISQHGAAAHVSLASFSEARLRALRKALPGVRSSLGTSAIAMLVLSSYLPGFLGRALAKICVPGPARGAEAVQVPIEHMHVKVVTPRFIRLSHARGLAVHVWTINTASTMLQLLNMGVDGIITDEPTLAQKVIDNFWDQRS